MITFTFARDSCARERLTSLINMYNNVLFDWTFSRMHVINTPDILCSSILLSKRIINSGPVSKCFHIDTFHLPHCI